MKNAIEIIKNFFLSTVNLDNSPGIKKAKAALAEVGNEFKSLVKEDDEIEVRYLFDESNRELYFVERWFKFAFRIYDGKFGLVITSRDANYHGFDREFQTFIPENQLTDWENIHAELSLAIDEEWKRVADALTIVDADRQEFARERTGHKVAFNGYSGGFGGAGVDNQAGESVGAANHYELMKIAKLNAESSKYQEDLYWIVDRRTNSPFWDFRPSFNFMFPVTEREVDGVPHYTVKMWGEYYQFIIKDMHKYDADSINEVYCPAKDLTFKSKLTCFGISAIEAYLKTKKHDYKIVKEY